MDDEVITWNLKGPKRMKKRRELNALIKNNHKYRNLLRGDSSTIDMFNLTSKNGRSSAGRLLNSRDSSSENEEFYFSANKSTIRERKRTYYCKIFQMFIIGLFITFAILVGIVLIFSYSKFHIIINDLKREVELQNDQNQKSIINLKQQIDQYDMIFKQLKNIESRITAIERINSSTMPESHLSRGINEIRNTRRKRSESAFTDGNFELAKSLNQIDITSRINTYLIEWMFNQSFSSIDITNEFKKINPFSKLNDDNKLRDIYTANRFGEESNGKSFLNDFHTIINEFIKKHKETKWSANDYLEIKSNYEPNNFESYLKSIEDGINNKILHQINISYFVPLFDAINKCKCPIDKSEIIPND